MNAQELINSQIKALQETLNLTNAKDRIAFVIFDRDTKAPKGVVCDDEEFLNSMSKFYQQVKSGTTRDSIVTLNQEGN